jgi:cephalosporin hydroxylase
MNYATLARKCNSKASQNPYELGKLLDFMKKKEIKSYLEIGARYGETLLAVREALGEDVRMVAVDLPNAGWGRANSEKVLQRVCEENDVRLILGDSKDVGVIASVQCDSPYDLIFIDGDHSFGGVTSDYRNYGPMTKYAAFHDVASKWDCSIFWSDVRDNRKHWEFVDTDIPLDRRMGIGVLEM